MIKIKRKSTPTQNPVLSGRCALCYSYPTQIGMLGIYQPTDQSAEIPYILCCDCANSTINNPDQATLRRIEQYITGK